MVSAKLGRELQIGANERRAKLRDQLFHRVAVITKALLTEAAVEARRVPRPVRAFMREGGVVAFGIAERVDRGQLDVIVATRVISLVAADADGGFRGREERFRLLDARNGFKLGLELGVIM